ncbi:MAG TPA: ATP-binding protein [Glaciibacter sp.]|nr:ATP-binding protein [Glaciibacter sp.]
MNDASGAVKVDGIAGAVQAASTEILRLLAVELSARGSVLAIDGELDPEFARQSRSILAEAFSALEEGSPAAALVSVEYGDAEMLVRTGEMRANQNFHPAESLMAAEALFGVALPLMVGVFGRPTDVDTVAIAQTLHHAVWRRFPPGAIAYVEVLRGRLAGANHESRNSVARELHDRVAHGIAAGIHRIELSSLGAVADGTSQREQHLVDATRILRSALEDVQNIAFDLRQRVGDAFLDDAIRDYVENGATVMPRIRFISTGTRALLASSVAEEAFTIVLEAIRNARHHAPTASEIVVSTVWGTDTLIVEVADDGPGFNPHEAPQGSFGIIGMRERAATVGAVVDIRSTDIGTRVTITVPMTTRIPE